MKEILNYEKSVSLCLSKYIKYGNANTMPVPNHSTLLMKNVYWKALEEDPWLKDYFPDYHPDYLPPWDFFWAVYKTKFPGKAQALITEA